MVRVGGAVGRVEADVDVHIAHRVAELDDGHLLSGPHVPWRVMGACKGDGTHAGRLDELQVLGDVLLLQAPCKRTKREGGPLAHDHNVNVAAAVRDVVTRKLGTPCG